MNDLENKTIKEFREKFSFVHNNNMSVEDFIRLSLQQAFKEGFKNGKERYNHLNRNWSHKQIKKGLCRQCVRKAMIGRTRCKYHLQILNEDTKQRRIRKMIESLPDLKKEI